MGAPKPQFATHFLIPPMRVPAMVDLTVEEAYRKKAVKKDNYDKLAALEERMRAIEGAELYDPIKVVQMCLFPNVKLPKECRVPKFIKYTGSQCPITQ